MKDPVFDTLVQAIDAHRLVALRDETGLLVLEPYLIFESAQGDLLLHGWQRSGVPHPSLPPDWCDLHLDDILHAEVAPGRFARPHPGYDPRRGHFHRIIYELDPRGPRPAAKPAVHPRLPRKNRQGPPGSRVARVRQPRQRPNW